MKDIYAGRKFAPAAWLATPEALRRIERVITETGPLVAWLRRNVPDDREDAAASDD
jgi:hypothetical protein